MAIPYFGVCSCCLFVEGSGGERSQSGSRLWSKQPMDGKPMDCLVEEGASEICFTCYCSDGRDASGGR